MAGNKYSDITEKTILETAKKQILEKGYEQVTLQGIAEACGLTRGAIYHHFKGKEEMIDAVTTYMFHETTSSYKLKEDTTLSGLEKLQNLLIASISNDEQLQMYAMLSKTFYKSPKLVSAYMLDCQNTVVPMTRVFIEDGIADGSIICDAPEILAEAVTVFFYLWLSPLVFSTTKDTLLSRVNYVRKMLEGVGLPLINEEAISAIHKMCDTIY